MSVGDGSRPLRALVITEDDPLYVIRFFEVFFAELPRDRIELIGITVDAAFHESKISTAKRVLRFYGPLGFLRQLWRFGLAKLGRKSIATLAQKAGVPLVPTTSVNSPEYVAKVREMGPDVVVSVAAPEIFKKDLLASARLGCINIHSGRLPKYRGMMPTFWQMLHGEKTATVTVHEMAAKLDAGAILDTLEYPLKERDSLDRVITETKREGARLMIRVLLAMREGRTNPTALDMGGAGYFSFPKPSDVAAFRKRGHRML